MYSIEIRKAVNGFWVVVHEDEIKEYVFSKESQVIKFIKDYFKSE